MGPRSTMWMFKQTVSDVNFTDIFVKKIFCWFCYTHGGYGFPFYVRFPSYIITHLTYAGPRIRASVFIYFVSGRKTDEGNDIGERGKKEDTLSPPNTSLGVSRQVTRVYTRARLRSVTPRTKRSMRIVRWARRLGFLACFAYLGLRSNSGCLILRSEVECIGYTLCIGW